MAKEMQVKFAKYWENYTIILAMGAILDPRLNLEVLEKAYERVDPSNSSFKTEELRTNLTKLYKEYQARTWDSSSGTSSTPTSHDLVTESPLEDDLDNRENQARFGDLAMMARDILSISITTIASESEYEGTIEDVDDMCNEDARKTTNISGVKGSRSEDSNGEGVRM
ncbi:zinc finger BED domain-containing protein DAYSLEEPER-like [Brassica napus]|uniref:zinc finger BED domain-containing protein DAYSLEEPER-like n=1 Tax=Brassica napus TaxID=3708 RepID=UPI0020791C79|nr:zinc finger BED domain-containing protein DAYSLEEPER-like [Brassica napus]